MRLLVCLRAPDGILIVDTCPTRADFASFATGTFPELLRRHGLADPDHVEDHPVHAAFVDGRPLDGLRDPVRSREVDGNS
jgi:hypothetical protein